MEDREKRAMPRLLSLNVGLPRDVAWRGKPTATLLNASPDQLTGLPEALVIVDENDVLRDEGEAYARKLSDAGVRVTSVRYNCTIHDFVMLNALADTPATRGAIASRRRPQRRAWLRARVRSGTRSGVPPRLVLVEVALTRKEEVMGTRMVGHCGPTKFNTHDRVLRWRSSGLARAGDENIRCRVNSFPRSRRMDVPRPNLVRQQQSRCDAVTERCARARREFLRSTRQ